MTGGDQPPAAPPRRSDARVTGGILLAFLATLLGFRWLVDLAGSAGCFALGALYLYGALRLWAASRRAWASSAFALGLVILSLGAVRSVNQAPRPGKPAMERPNVYYTDWLRTEEQRVRARLDPDQSVKLAFDRGPGLVLQVRTAGVPAGKAADLSERLRRDFQTSYPKALLQVRVAPAADPAPQPC